MRFRFMTGLMIGCFFLGLGGLHVFAAPPEPTMMRFLSWIEAHPKVSPARVIQFIDTYESSSALSSGAQLFLTTLAGGLEDHVYRPVKGKVMQAKDCHRNERFVTQRQRCFPEYFFSQPDRWERFMRTHAEIFLPITTIAGRYTGQDLYRIDQNDTIVPIDHIVIPPQHRMIREMFGRLIPVGFRQDLFTLGVFTDPRSKQAALITRRQEGANDWVLFINQDAFFPQNIFNPAQSISAIIHEFAHLLTLNHTQVAYYPISQERGAVVIDDFVKTCVTSLIQEGCLLTGSYLHAFINLFRTEEEVKQTNRMDDPKRSQKLYRDHPHKFLNDYAATNPMEDIAESFTAFILQNPTTGTTIADQKVQFFQTYPELVTLRIHIKNRLRQLLGTDKKPLSPTK